MTPGRAGRDCFARGGEAIPPQHHRGRIGIPSALCLLARADRRPGHVPRAVGLGPCGASWRGGPMAVRQGVGPWVRLALFPHGHQRWASWRRTGSRASRTVHQLPPMFLIPEGGCGVWRPTYSECAKSRKGQARSIMPRRRRVRLTRGRAGGAAWSGSSRVLGDW